MLVHVEYEKRLDNYIGAQGTFKIRVRVSLNPLIMLDSHHVQALGLCSSGDFLRCGRVSRVNLDLNSRVRENHTILARWVNPR